MIAPREDERLSPRAAKIVDEILWKLQEESSAEVIHELATPLPARLIAEALGIPAAD